MAAPKSSDHAAHQKTPVTILTGFLGAGKTTLLNYILKAKGSRSIAVIENEFGEVNIDSALVADNLLAKEDLVSLENGCVCCSLRKDIVKAFAEIERRSRHQGKRVDAIVLETTGLADPAPVAFTFFANPWLASRYRLDSIICVVDARYLMQHLEDGKHPEGPINEAVQQIAFADLILLNKVDLVADEDAKRQVLSAIKRINNSARIIECQLNQETGRPPMETLLFNNLFSVNRVLEQVDPQFLDSDSDDDGDDDQLPPPQSAASPEWQLPGHQADRDIMDRTASGAHASSSAGPSASAPGTRPTSVTEAGAPVTTAAAPSTTLAAGREDRAALAAAAAAARTEAQAGPGGGGASGAGAGPDSSNPSAAALIGDADAAAGAATTAAAAASDAATARALLKYQQRLSGHKHGRDGQPSSGGHHPHKGGHHHPHSALECEDNCEECKVAVGMKAQAERNPKRRAKRLHDLSDISSVGIMARGPLDEYRFNMYMRDLLAEKAQDIFRCKGVLSVHGYGSTKFVFQGVHETICYGPAEQPWRPDEAPVNQVVFIGRGLDRKALIEGFRTCVWVPLPDGWDEFRDPATKQPYYVHRASGEKTWTRPEFACPRVVATQGATMQPSKLLPRRQHPQHPQEQAVGAAAAGAAQQQQQDPAAALAVTPAGTVPSAGALGTASN
ncbi:hypothetical protein Agub_g10838 [Astrephomene gubernaculifera]|uniref:WW domain-containing protein n=1 Tax=Astrephomene gubernaculifera TaxID=47775 RepID=A0AAD3DYE1_9CHLO|nr:hypothetical protein Agub_g10838 [Astrephomene gubernaculifera]